MSCSSCSASPCACDQLPLCLDEDPCGHIDLCARVNPDWPYVSVCTGDTVHNLWMRPTASGGQCTLDQLNYGQVVAVLESHPFAKRDLLRITNDPCLIRLANEVKLKVPEQEENKALMDRLNRNTLPFYTVLRGNLDGSIIG